MSLFNIPIVLFKLINTIMLFLIILLSTIFNPKYHIEFIIKKSQYLTNISTITQIL